MAGLQETIDQQADFIHRDYPGRILALPRRVVIPGSVQRSLEALPTAPVRIRIHLRMT